MNFDFGSIAIYIFGLFLIVLICILFKRPFIWLFRLMLTCALGGAVIFALNFILSLFGLHIALNPLNALITGVLGAPGLTMLLVLGTVL